MDSGRLSMSGSSIFVLSIKTHTHTETHTNEHSICCGHFLLFLGDGYRQQLPLLLLIFARIFVGLYGEVSRAATGRPNDRMGRSCRWRDGLNAKESATLLSCSSRTQNTFITRRKDRDTRRRVGEKKKKNLPRL